MIGGEDGLADPGRESAAHQHYEKRKDDVELFFNREGPGVEQGLHSAEYVEVAGLAPEEEVGRRKRSPRALSDRRPQARWEQNRAELGRWYQGMWRASRGKMRRIRQRVRS